MKLRRFTSEKLHGYANFDVRFDDRLTFLTGINGSGKTSVLNAVLALITPDLAMLQAMDYVYIRLDVLDDQGAKNWIEARKGVGDDVQLAIGSSTSTFSYSSYSQDVGLNSARQLEMEAEHYREVAALASHHAVMEFIASLPTPMFLGIDRRARLAPEDRRNYIGLRPRSINQRNVFRNSLATGLNEAADLAQSAFREARFNAGRIGEQLQKQLILSLLTFSEEDFGTISIPTPAEKESVKRIEEDLEEFPTIFKLPKAEVLKRVKPFLATIQKTLKSIPSDADYSAYFEQHKAAPKYFDALVRWSTNKSQIKRIGIISEMVAEYNQQQSVALEGITRYKKLINEFLKESGKRVEYDDYGEVEVHIPGIADGKPLTSLSSGEAQIFVMLTNLMFNPSAQRANVFIIDEPELSLHLRWQELFVDSMLSANERTQFIMATHAPSIILEKVKNGVDVASRRRVAKHA